ncbi:rubrerythrin-like domain-containing protein [Halostagnicola sp. A-GB9-2]|nr:rubrerythrin-like domain-containing protein [Halostagnicola sp. A-GB9-2]MDJ1433426.1 rubrerythrin-like domain-containing protein [Halostagnicola sp. A-GB9-2]
MSRPVQLEYECFRCGRRETVDDALLSECPRCGGDMRNVDRIQTY